MREALVDDLCRRFDRLNESRVGDIITGTFRYFRLFSIVVLVAKISRTRPVGHYWTCNTHTVHHTTWCYTVCCTKCNTLLCEQSDTRISDCSGGDFWFINWLRIDIIDHRWHLCMKQWRLLIVVEDAIIHVVNMFVKRVCHWPRVPYLIIQASLFVSYVQIMYKSPADILKGFCLYLRYLIFCTAIFCTRVSTRSELCRWFCLQMLAYWCWWIYRYISYHSPADILKGFCLSRITVDLLDERYSRDSVRQWLFPVDKQWPN
jgi:hypothetical protein